MSYANAHQVPYVALIGETEIKQNVVALKNMTTGEQKSVSMEEAIAEITAARPE